MIPSFNEIVLSLYGAWRLAWRDPGGIGFFDASVDGVVRSFFAAALVAPLYALMLAIRFSALVEQPDPLVFALAETIAYLVSWLAFPLAMVTITRALDFFDRWPLFVCAYNWSLVVQNAVVLPLAVLSTAGLIAPAVGDYLWLPLLAVLVAYAWFVVRTALGVTAGAAIGIVGLDFGLSFLIDALATSMH